MGTWESQGGRAGVYSEPVWWTRACGATVLQSGRHQACQSLVYRAYLAMLQAFSDSEIRRYPQRPLMAECYPIVSSGALLAVAEHVGQMLWQRNHLFLLWLMSAMLSGLWMLRHSGVERQRPGQHGRGRHTISVIDLWHL